MATQQNMLDLLHTAHDEYMAGKLSDEKYIAYVNITLDADTQRIEFEADPVGFNRRLRDKAVRAGLIPV